MTNEVVAFPKHDINPKEKGREWHLQAAKAITSNWAQGMQEGSIFFAKRKQYDEIDNYFMAMQNTLRYLEWQTGEKNPSASWINQDQSVDSQLKTHVQKLLGRLKKINYNIIATPLDSTAKSKLDEWYDTMRIKALARQAAMQTNPAYAQTAPLIQGADEPGDLEELDLAVRFSPKFLRAKDVEQAVSMIFYKNNFDSLKDKMDEDLVKYGVCVPREGLDVNNEVFIKVYQPKNFVCSYSEDGDFEDITHAGVYEMVSLSELAPYFDAQELSKIADSVKGQYGNPGYYNTTTTRGYDPFKVQIFDFEIKSYDSVAYEERTTRQGNKRYGRTNYTNLKKDSQTYTGEGAARKYSGSTREEIYKGKWIVGTDFIYDFGKAANNKRSMNRRYAAKTKLSFLPVASAFSKMRARGIMEDLMSVGDEIQMVVNKMRTLRNTMITNAIAIDFSALEGVALGDSGANLSPKEVLELFLQIGVLAYRSENIIQEGKNQRKPVEAIAMQGAIELANMWIDYNNLSNKLYEISGLNRTTDSATVNPKTLVGIANAQNAGTNNALYFLENARRKAVEKLAKNCIQRFQTALLMGDYQSEYADVLGDNTIQYFKFAASQMPCDYSIVIEDKATDEQKQMVVELMAQEIKEGLITSADIFMVLNAYNLKDAQVILDTRINRAKKQRQAEALQLQKANGEEQRASNMQAEEEKRKTLELQSGLKVNEINATKEWEYKIEELRLRNAEATTIHNNATALAKEGMKTNNGEPPMEATPPPPPFSPDASPLPEEENEMAEQEEPEMA